MALSQWKEAILEGIFMEIEEGVVMEKNLERLENLVEILQKEGSKVPELVMERRSTAQTYEWEDSIEDSDGEMGDDAEGPSKSKRKNIVVSPVKRTQSPEGGRRKKVPWCTAETLAVLKGYEKYGANWKRIKDECPILFRRTNGDIKDKFRVEMKRQERQH